MTPAQLLAARLVVTLRLRRGGTIPDELWAQAAGDAVALAEIDEARGRIARLVTTGQPITEALWAAASPHRTAKS